VTIEVQLARLAELHSIDLLHLTEWWAERAAIREYDGCMSRTEAERLALGDVEESLP
jgi:hypothetical protein